VTGAGSPAAPRPTALVVFPGAGGGAGMFAAVRRELSPGDELIVPDLPGRGRRAGFPPEAGVDKLVHDLADEVTARVAERPWALFGTSFGTLLAVEYLREVYRRAAPAPAVLVVSGRRPPDRAGGYGQYLGWCDDRLWAHLGGPDPADLPAELRVLVLERLRADIRLGAGYRYRPGKPFAAPIVACHGTAETGVSTVDLIAWRNHTTGGFRLVEVSGDHYFYRSRPRDLLAAAGMSGGPA